ncbi:hypothetical protein SORBI_3001G298700 [Sorghum bicolor]|uniref:Uncharacterized protein n=1 Tax=Sorghum bicolor TaxID=4558 RepID=A0A1Z5S889_SORBI|nr:hypothetical protein SORBI_3001G298700 [Sorghum bicolor]
MVWEAERAAAGALQAARQTRTATVVVFVAGQATVEASRPSASSTQSGSSSPATPFGQLIRGPPAPGVTLLLRLPERNLLKSSRNWLFNSLFLILTSLPGELQL